MSNKNASNQSGGAIQQSCPNCGHCPHCGRSNWHGWQWRYPYQPTWVVQNPPYYTYTGTSTSPTVTYC